MPERKSNIAVILLACLLIFLILIFALRPFLQRWVSGFLENLSAKHETVKGMDIRPGGEKKATKEQLRDIENRLSREEEEYNQAKRQEEFRKRQYDILAFENSVLTVEKEAREAFFAQEQLIAKWKSGQLSNAEAYEKTIATREKCEQVKKEVRFIRVPENLPPQVKSLLESARQDIALSYGKKVEALDSLLKFIDDNKPSDQHKFYEDFSASRGYATTAALNIIEAKRQSGIDPLKEKTQEPANTAKPKCNYTINGIFYSKKNPFVFINEKIYYMNDGICGACISTILPNKVVLKFSDGEKEYRVGDIDSR